MGSGRIIGSCGQKTAIVKDKRDGAKKALNAQKKPQLGAKFSTVNQQFDLEWYISREKVGDY